MQKKINHGSLFSGIGGFDLAAEWMGWENVFHCEWNPFGQRVLQYHFPNSISYHDITKRDFTIHRGAIDIITGGFPCQPYSVAGKRKGKEDERHLWPQMLRAIREIQPTWVVGENVFGLVNWSGGLVFEEVQADLEAEGYEVQPYILPAAGVDAPHKRDRVWFVAYSNNKRNNTGLGEVQETDGEIPKRHGNAESGDTDQHNDAENSDSSGCLFRKFKKGESEIRGFGDTCTGDNEQLCRKEGFVVADTSDARLQRGELNTTPYKEGQKGREQSPRPTAKRYKIDDWGNFPTQSPVCAGNDGVSARLDGITFSKWRNESIKAAGNAVVPQVALQIFKAIEQYESLYGH